jgi:alkylation response protein AidB-like acyl-CoA dehydrogenase
MEPGTRNVEHTDLPDRARAVATLADAHAAWGDEHGQLAPQVVDALHSEGLYGMWTPHVIRGGSELDPVSSLRVLENLAYGDPSAGWVLMASALAIGTAGSYLQDAAVESLFAGERLPVIAGQGTRPGTAIPVTGGFRLTGSWSFASGIKHGTHIHTLGLIKDTNEARIFVVPVEQATLIDNWDVLGLRATGSIDYRIDDVFVPETFTHLATTETPLRGGGFYTMGIIGIACLCHSGWACGIGRRLLDEMAANVRGKAGRAGTLADSDSFLEQYAKAEAGYRAARALVFETWNEIHEALGGGNRLSVRQHTMMRLAMANVTWASHAVAELVYTAAGTVALRSGTLQRLFRDMHAGTQHITSSPPVFTRAGRELAGLAAGKKWLFLDLIDG